MSTMKNKGGPSIRRITVALDASSRSREIIETAAGLAARLGSELTGLFVEDIDLLRLTELPFVREVGFFSPVLRTVDRMSLERQLRAQAAWMRQMLKETAERFMVPWKFRVARGAVATELLAAGAGADLLILGKVGRSLLKRNRMGSTVRSLLLIRPGLTMILEEKRSQYSGPLPVVVLYDGTDLARKALRAAACLVDEKNTPLKVILLARNEGHADEMEDEIGQICNAQGVKTETRRLFRPTLEKVAGILRTESKGAVVIPCDHQLFSEEALCRLMDEITNHVLVVRP